ncbi:MAG: bifunctional 2-C-methyl-D-erythritol 4-phosphate cytidylyltransferase/2-C-methyl-D-erythritol 2,4-cyclodiphosphate synthase [Paracoccaceae bacterium]
MPSPLAPSRPPVCAALIVAAGRGARAGGDLPKQWQPLRGARVIDHTLARFAGHQGIDMIQLVLHPDDMTRIAPRAGLSVCAGGATRAASVRMGLEALAALPKGSRPSRVLIHDVARPCVSDQVICKVLAALGQSPAAAPALPVIDALWRGENGAVTGLADRTGLYRAQTPQGFDFETILKAHQSSAGDAADDVEIARAAGIAVTITQGSDDNIKITHPEDFARAEAILTRSDAQPAGATMTAPRPFDIRLGNGYDVHRFTDGDHVILCGVRIPHSRALLGHSDADVGMHAVTDAIYGALAMGDIGRHFPPSDPQWKGAASEIFLAHAGNLAREKGFEISNIDCTLICERPKIGPHAEAMQTQLARILQIDAARISVKATTSERLGFTGREEGIASIATATLVTPQ